ncbi:MAG TPA: S9 family peptidase [Polyangiaceae bacterium]|nr:S9 family peptidase [Polyangiaceae bacterium]
MPFDVERLLSLGRVSSVVPSPGGAWLCAAVARLDEGRARYVSDLWRVPLDGSPPSHLTRGKYNDRAPCFRRDGALGFLSKRPVKDAGMPARGPQEADDEERDQVWLLPAAGGEPFPLTDEPLGVSQFRFAAEGDLLVVVSDMLDAVPLGDQRARAKELGKKGPTDLHFRNRSGPIRHWDHWLGRERPHVVVFDDRGGVRRDLTPTARDEYTGDLAIAASRDGTRVAVTERVAGDDRLIDWAIRLFDTREGTSRLVAHAPRHEHGHPLFSRDGEHLYFNRSRRSKDAHGKVELCEAGLSTGDTRVLCEAWDRWPIPQAIHGDHGLVVTADDEGTVPAFLVDTRTSAVVRITRQADGGSHDGLSAMDDGRIVGIRHSIRQPPEPFVVEATRDASPRIVARLSGFDPKEAEHVVTSSFDVKAKDGARVQSWWVEPTGGERQGTLLWIHGGPIGFFGDAWHWRWCSLVMADAGWALAMPNPRGSTGFGQDFVEGIWKNSWGTTCYEDIMSVADAVERRPGVDKSRIAAMGGSFGGYMVNWMGGHTKRFAALVTHASLFHLEAMCGASDYGPYFAIEMGTTSWKDRAEFEKNSPHRFVGEWKTPTLVLHGEKDYRVPISEALILFDALQEHGVHSELVVFPDENHWILRPRNVVAWYDHVLRFLREHVSG